MLTKALSLLLVILLGLALGLETARFVHAHIVGAGGGVAGAANVVNIHRLLGFSLLATSGALLLSLRGAGSWLSRQWSRFTVWLELTFDDFSSPAVGDGLGSVGIHNSTVVTGHIRTLKRLHSEGVPSPDTPEYEACAQAALDDAAKTTCSGCGKRGHWSPDCPDARPPLRQAELYTK